jgi:hypothetical protein
MAELRRGFTDDDRDERRLTGAVAAHETDLLTRTHHE